MALVFDLGSPNSPKGHALLYFEDSAQRGRWLSTYVVVLPVKVDLSKYLPPMFLSQAQMGSLDIQDMSAFAFPPCRSRSTAGTGWSISPPYAATTSSMAEHCPARTCNAR